MFCLIHAVVSLFLASLVVSTPIPRANPSTVTACQLKTIDNRTVTCFNATFPDECATADRAAGPITRGFERFEITTPGEKAALVSLMLFETGGLKANRNHFPTPGNPGQGTRSLMNFPFVFKYALDIPAVAPQAQKLLPQFNAASNFTDLSNVDPTTKNAVLALVLDDDNSFASVAWFLKASGVCNSTFVDGLKAGTVAGWESYITGCVGTTVTDDRRALYDASLKAFSK